MFSRKSYWSYLPVQSNFFKKDYANSINKVFQFLEHPEQILHQLCRVCLPDTMEYINKKLLGIEDR